MILKMVLRSIWESNIQMMKFDVLFLSTVSFTKQATSYFLPAAAAAPPLPLPPPLPLRLLQLPLPPAFPIFTGFKPVTCSASSALSSDSYLTLPATSPLISISWIFFKISCSFSSLDDFMDDSSSWIASSTHFRHRAFSFFAIWFRLKSVGGRDCLHFAHVTGRSLALAFALALALALIVSDVVDAVAFFAAAARRSFSSCAAVHVLHFSAPPVLRYFSSA